MRLIVVDDQFDKLNLAQSLRFLQKDGFGVEGLANFDQGELWKKVTEEKNIEDVSPCVVLLDILHGSREAGIELFKKLGEDKRWQTLNGRAQIVFFSNDATAKRHYDISKEKRPDVSGYLSKQKLLSQELSALEVLRKAKLRAEQHYQDGSLADPIWMECGLLASPNSPILKVRDQILRAGRCCEPVLIQGGTGTGKELVAQAIFKVMQKFSAHHNFKLEGSYGEKPLAYNIGSAPTEGNLQYVELFGAVTNAFVGCTKYRKGLFEAATRAQGRTIFLDEIGDAPPIIQVALLRVLQDKTVTPLGAFAEGDVSIAVPVKFRLITASHKNLPEHVQEGKFREDLYYRLNTIEIEVPPLLERPDDISILAQYFLDKLNDKENGYGQYGLEKHISDPAAFEKLKDYRWPGNVRQLESYIRRCYVMSPPNQFVLLEEEFERLKTHTPAPSTSPEDILKSLDASPRSLTTLIEEHGKKRVEVFGQYLVDLLGRIPNADDCEKYFGKEAKHANIRKWLNEHAIFSPRNKRLQEGLDPK